MIMGKNNRIDSLRQLVSPNEVFDETTGHKLAVVDGAIVELRYCAKCGKWHPLDMFYANKQSKDGLASWCKSCIKQYDKARHHSHSSSNTDSISVSENLSEKSQNQEKDSEPNTSIASIASALQDTFDKIVESYETKIKELNSDIDSLKRTLSQRADLTKLSESEIDTILKTNKVPPRILFNAIKRIDSRYSFICKDSITGLVTPIKTEAA